MAEEESEEGELILEENCGDWERSGKGNHVHVESELVLAMPAAVRPDAAVWPDAAVQPDASVWADGERESVSSEDLPFDANVHRVKGGVDWIDSTVHPLESRDRCNSYGSDSVGLRARKGNMPKSTGATHMALTR